MTCNKYLLSTLPFFTTRDLNASFNTESHDHPPATTSLPPFPPKKIKKLNESKNNTSIAHLNVQTLTSTFNDISLMLNEYETRHEIKTINSNKNKLRSVVITQFLKIEPIREVVW